MRFFVHNRVVLCLCLLAIGLWSPSSISQQTPNPDVVKVFFSPIDKNGSLITTLTRDDIRVLDDGVPQTITSFERTTEQPLAIHLLIDASLSQYRLEDTTKLTARSFVENVMRSEKDQTGIIRFAGVAMLEQELTTDKQAVLQAIDRLHFATPVTSGIGTILGKPEPDAPAASAVWDTLWEAAERVALFSNPRTRRAILLLSDGTDTYSRNEMHDAIERALKFDVAIYAIGMGDKNYEGVQQSVLKKLAEQTGGRAFFPRKIIELPAIFAQLGEELHSPYVIRYARTNRKPPGKI